MEKIDKKAVLEILSTDLKIWDKLFTKINALPTTNDEAKHIKIYKWLLGHTDFPAQQDGEGKYYWRKHLRKKLAEIGIPEADLKLDPTK